MNSGLTADGQSIVPSSYALNSITLVNHKDEAMDIQHLITEFSIKESIYSPTLVASFSVKDSINAFEFLNIVGQEKLVVDLVKTDEDNEKTFQHAFYITEYPLYSKVKNDQLQVYTFSAISEHAYISSLKKISRAYAGNTVETIEQILIKDCKVLEEKVVKNEASTSVRGVYPYQSPFKTIGDLLAVTSDEVQSPFYLFQTLTGEVNIHSLAHLLKQEPYQKFTKAKEFTAAPLTKEDYIERQTKILTITSDLKLGTLFQMKKGAYASENNTLNVSNKTYTKKDYSYNTDFRAHTPNNLSSTFQIDKQPLETYSKAYCEYISTNSLSFDEAPDPNYNGERKTNGHLLTAHHELLDTITHDISVYGDLDLTAGTMIELVLPKAISPEDQKGTTGEEGQIDEFLSGKYLITSTKHSFENGKYFITARVKKDTLNYENG